MTTALPVIKAQLDELLQRGVWDHIQLAEDARALHSVIGDRSEHLNDRGWGPAFGFIQVLLGNELSLAIGRLFDRPKNYPTQSILAVLAFLEREAHTLIPVRRDVLERYLISHGAGAADLGALSHAEMTTRLVGHLRGAMPAEDKLDPGAVSDAYARFLFRRDKVVAHTERVEPAARVAVRWEDAEPILRFAKEFLAIVGESYTDRLYLAGDGSFLFDRSARHVARNLTWFFDESQILPDVLNADRSRGRDAG